MVIQDTIAVQPPNDNEETAPSSQPIVGIIYPPPEVRSILSQHKYLQHLYIYQQILYM